MFGLHKKIRKAVIGKYLFSFQLIICKQELETRSKAAGELEGKTKTLKNDLFSKSKQIKELEKEVNTFFLFKSNES